jgi:hypothetical protein
MTDWSVIVNADYRRNPHIAVNAVEGACAGAADAKYHPQNLGSVGWQLS